MEKRFVVSFVSIFLLLSFVSAGISLIEPNEIYNLGDRIYVSADGLVGSDTGNLNFNLICDNNTINLARVSARAFSSEGDSWGIPYKVLTSEDLEIENISNIVGSCQITASLGSHVAATKKFTISDRIEIDAKLDKAEYLPGEGITLDVLATKVNGALVNGFIEGSNATSFSKAVNNGEVKEIFSMPKTAESGVYTLDLRVYDAGESGVLNEGIEQISFRIKQVASSLVMGISEEEVSPEDSLDVSVEIYDQSGKEMEGLVSVQVFSPLGSIKSYNLEAGEKIEIDFESNSTPGEWIVSSAFEGILEDRVFKVLDFQKVDFVFEDSVLNIKNIGNTRYNKTIEVKIGEEIMKLDLNIGVGEVRKFNLKAPQGEYEVVVGDGDTVTTGSVLLTGNAISIEDFRGMNIFRSYFLVWFFLILVLGGTGTVLVIRYRNRTKIIGEKRSFKGFLIWFWAKLKEIFRMGKNKKDKNKMESVEISKKLESEKVVDMTKEKMSNAESTLVLNGQKLNSTILCINIKNNDSLNENSKKTLGIVVEKVRELKGLVDWKEEYLLVVFSPLVTKTYNNEVIAVRAGTRVSQILRDHNKKFSNKIEFNLGVHSGELIASKREGKLKYTGIGNTVSLVKRISVMDSGKILVSEDVRKKMMRDLKVEKVGKLGDNQVYEVFEMRNKEANAAKLQDLLRRMDS